jgi:hypothetical protein
MDDLQPPSQSKSTSRSWLQLVWGDLEFPNDVDIRRVTHTFLIIVFVGLIFVAFYAGLSKSMASWLLASSGFFACGITAGFLFAIPRALVKHVNSNLEVISDWLTKILVGVGLTEFKQIPGALRQLSQFVAGGDKSSGQDQSFALFVILYFFFGGFVGGYLETRVYVTGAFLRADEELQKHIMAMTPETPKGADSN